MSQQANSVTAFPYCTFEIYSHRRSCRLERKLQLTNFWNFARFYTILNHIGHAYLRERPVTRMRRSHNIGLLTKLATPS